MQTVWSKVGLGLSIFLTLAGLAIMGAGFFIHWGMVLSGIMIAVISGIGLYWSVDKTHGLN